MHQITDLINSFISSSKLADNICVDIGYVRTFIKEVNELIAEFEISDPETGIRKMVFLVGESLSNIGVSFP